MAERRIPAVTLFRDREQHPFESIGRESKLGRWAPIPIGIIVGYGFAHGYSKLVTGPEHFAEIPPRPGCLHAKTDGLGNHCR